MRRQLILPALLLTLSGCNSYGPEELDRLTKEDPAFKQMIVARDQVHSEIRKVKQELLAKKGEADLQVSRIRREYDAYAKAQNEKIEKYRTVLETHRSVLRRDIESDSAQLETKEADLERLLRNQSEVAKVLKESKDLVLSAAERQKWEERSLMISEKIKPLEEEIRELRAAIRLNRRKISYLK